MIDISVSDVELFPTGFDQRCVALMGHHPDDLAPLGLGACARETVFACRPPIRLETPLLLVLDRQ